MNCLDLNNISSGIFELPESVSLLEINPNPASNDITVNTELIGSERGFLAIYNIAGQLIYHRIVQSEGNIRIDVASLPEGQYFIFLRTDSKQFQGKFVKF